MHRDPTDLTLVELLDAGPPDPAPQWPPVPPAPAHPGPDWEQRRTEGTGWLVWVQPLSSGPDSAGASGARWADHRARYPATGLWPLLVDETFWESVEFEADPSSETFPDTRKLLRSMLATYTGEPGGPEPADRVQRGPMPEVAPDLRSVDQAVSDPEATALVLVPTQAPWLVPRLLNWEGAVNYDLHGSEHCAVLGRWSALYGAELVGLTRDVVRLWVPRPPTDPYGRLQAAAELYAYCPDTVDQGVETLEKLTAMSGSREWWLWWD